jgi:putative hydroxymethylpyrimidine transporter CytX
MNKESQNNMSAFSFMTLWFGAAVSIAEILTGGFIAPLGFKKGVLAIVIGHLIGTLALVLAGFIGTSERIPAIKSTRISFGAYGSYVFSIFNVLQLIGWTTVMIITGARSVNLISKTIWNFDSMTFWSVFIGALVCLWIVFGRKGWEKLNNIAVTLLFALTIVLSFVVFKNGNLFSAHAEGSISFGGAVELSAVMPLSWLPLIADYTRFARSRKGGVLGSFTGYFFGSCWMYVIGLGAAIVTQNGDPAAMMVAANLGFSALGIVVLATVTTTFMDVYSAGVSFLNIFPKLDEKKIALAMGVLGTVLALVINMEQYETFLYAIGSVFAPMFAILLTDYFLYKNNQIEEGPAVNWLAITVWAAGVAIYYQFIKLDFILGATVPVMIITIFVHIILKEAVKKWNYLKGYAEI